MTQPIAPTAGAADPNTAGGRGRTLMFGLVALVAVVLVTFLALRLFGGTNAEVTLRSLGSAGDDPFTDSVAPAPSASLSDFADGGFPAGSAPAGATLGTAGTGTLAQYRTVSATVPGVFGGSLNEQTCDKNQLVTFLNSEPAKAQAWASILAMDPDNIAAYVDSLTGVNLGADTRVLDHGFSDGKLVARQAVLQRGTAVLIDSRGVPRVDCFSGNPLRQPTIEGDETFVGTPWPSFNQTEVVVIEDASDDVAEFELVSVDDGTSFTRPAGTTGAADASASASAEIEATPEPTPVPTTPTPVPVTRELTMAGDIDVNTRVQGEVGSAQAELIYTFEAPAGARLEIQASNDRASVAGFSVELLSAGRHLTFFRVSPGGSESVPLTLSHEDGGEYELIIGEGPASFDFVVQASPQNDAGQGRDAGADFATALEIESGQTVAGHLGGLDGADSYVLDLVDAPLMRLTTTAERGSQQGVAFDLQILGERLDFFRVSPAAQETIEILFGDDDDLLEFYVTEGPVDYGFTAELIPQRDGGQNGDAPSELAEARVLGVIDSFLGQVGDRDTSDYYLFEAPADAFTLTVDVTARSTARLGVDLLGPDGVRIEFFRVQPGASNSIEVEGVEGETYRLILTEGRADYEVTIS